MNHTKAMHHIYASCQGISTVSLHALLPALCIVNAQLALIRFYDMSPQVDSEREFPLVHKQIFNFDNIMNHIHVFLSHHSTSGILKNLALSVCSPNL